MFLQLEKSLSANSIEAYTRDIDKLVRFMELQYDSLPPSRVELHHLTSFLAWVNELGLSAGSQARIISGIKSFYKFLLLEDVIETDPTTLLESPRIGRKLPEVLNHEEVELILAEIDLSSPAGRRNKAILDAEKLRRFAIGNRCRRGPQVRQAGGAVLDERRQRFGCDETPR